MDLYMMFVAQVVSSIFGAILQGVGLTLGYFAVKRLLKK